MKVSELFESKASVKHSDVVKMVYNIALSALKAPANIKSEAAQLIRDTDQFWSSEIDRVTTALEKFVSGAKMNDENVLDALDSALHEVGSEMVDYFTDRMNHAPGYKVPKASFDVSKISENTLRKALATIPGYKEMQNSLMKKQKSVGAASKAAHKMAVKNVTDKDIQDVIKYLKKDFEKTYTDKAAKAIKSNPKGYDVEKADADALTDGESVKALVKKVYKNLNSPDAALMQWVDDVSTNFEKPKSYEAVRDNKAAAAKVVSALS